MIDNLRDLLILHEGRRAKKYQDSEGYWTIGVGHLIDARKGGTLPVSIAVALMRRGVQIFDGEPMPEDLIDQMLDIDIKEHVDLLEKMQPWVRDLDPVRRAVLSDMMFNLGPEPFDNDGIKDWPMFVRQVRTFDYAAAAKNMRGTKWATQVKDRAERLATMMETGEWSSA